MKKVVLINVIVFIIAMGASIGQSKKDKIVMTIDNTGITRSEFERIYHKNNTHVDPKSVEEYLDLFTNFKLKVIEAERLGMDTISSFITELAGYRQQLAKSYLDNAEIEDKYMKEAYERTLNEVNADHILLSVNFTGATPEDTLKAYNKLLEIRERVKNGESFEELAKEFSEDANTKPNGGKLGYFVAFRMIYPFETAAFTTKAGEISMPLRSFYGYHIIKVNDKRPSMGEVKIAHIWIGVPNGSSESLFEEAKKRVDSCYQMLSHGADFKELAAKFSDDRNSARNGGELNWFGAGRMIPEFENAAFGLQDIGDFCEPLKTNYGYHIIKLLNKRPIKSYEEYYKEYIERLRRDEYRQKAIQAESAKMYIKDYQYKKYKDNIQKLLPKLDKEFFTTGKISDSSDIKKVLFTINKKPYLLGDFVNYIKEKKLLSNTTWLYLSDTYKEFVTDQILKYEEMNLEHKYPDFRYLMDEYHDGILLFDLTDKIVWSKAIQDTAGLQSYYEQNKKEYQWEDRVDATVYTSTQEESAKKALEWIRGKKQEGFTNQDVIDHVCAEFTKDCIKIKQGLFEKGDNKMVDTTGWEIGVSDIFFVDGKYTFVMVKEKLGPQQKELNEARGLVTADYQNYLEKQWVQALRNKYTIKVNQDVLRSIK